MRLKFIFWCLVFTCLLMKSYSQEEQRRAKSFFIGCNPVAILTEIPNQFTNLYLPLASNLETGIAVNCGLYFKRQTFETRFVYGYPNKLFSLFQFHAGINYYFNAKQNKETGGWFAGVFSKLYLLNNRKTNTNYNSIIPYITAGYEFHFYSIFIQLRINQTLYAVTWSDLENTSVHSNPHFTVYNGIAPVIPFVNVNIGYNFNLHKIIRN